MELFILVNVMPKGQGGMDPAVSLFTIHAISRRVQRNLVALLGLIIAVTAAVSSHGAPSDPSGGAGAKGEAKRSVAISVLSWWSPIGGLNGSKWWKGDGFNYLGAKASNGVLNYPLSANLPPSLQPPKVGSDEFYAAQYGAAVEDLKQMRAAGFDVAFYDMLPNPAFDPAKPLSQTNEPLTFYKMFLQWVKAGEQTGMKLAPFADAMNRSGDYPQGYKLNAEEWVKSLAGVLDNLGDSPAIWRVEGKPVLIHFGTDVLAGPPPIPGAPGPDGGWRDVLKVLHGRGHSFYFIADIRIHNKDKFEWQKFADAAYVFSPSGPATYLVEAQLENMQVLGLPFMWIVSPGYYRTSVDAYTQPDFQRIHDTYMAALKSGVSMINVLTWNDFEEDTDITPSANKGKALLDIFGYYNQWFKSGQQPKLERDKVILAYPMRIPVTVKTRSPQWGRKGRWNAPPYAPKVFYWANVEAKKILELPGVGKVELPAGLSMGEICCAGPTPALVAKMGENASRYPGIEEIAVEKQRNAEGGLEYRYIEVAP